MTEARTKQGKGSDLGPIKMKPRVGWTLLQCSICKKVVTYFFRTHTKWVKKITKTSNIKSNVIVI